MNLESFSNELLLDLFEYLPVVYLLRAFNDLNFRFNNLILIHFQRFDLNFRSISQYDFKIICRQYLPAIADCISFLTLSNDDDTPQQIDLFLEHGLIISQFINLKSLSLCDLCSDEIMIKMMLEWKYLVNLTHLTLAGCYLKFDQINAQRLIDSIWNLSKLIYCYLNISFNENNILVPTVMSSSLKYVFIWGIEHCQNEINALFKQTPCLQYFSILLNIDSNDNNDVEYPFLSITKLKFYLSRIQEDRIIKFLQNMPNLYQLIIDICSLDQDYTNAILNGCQWKKIIRNNLPNLHIFRFRMEFQLTNENNREQQIDELINSFQSSFWIKEHNWFIQCHWHSINSSSSIYLYTLPYSFDDFNFNYSMKFKSTYPNNNNNNYMHYNHVHSLKYDMSSIEEVFSSSIQFFNLQTLFVKFPVNDHFWSLIPKFNQLISLIISINDDNNIQSQLQFLLDHTPCLYSLSFSSCSSTFLPQILSFEFRNKSIRRLDLRGYDQYFTDEQCLILSHSSLGIQCEILFIKIQNYQILLDILNNMINLRTLIIQCENDKFNETNNDELIVWLKDHLPSTCVISRDLIFYCDIRIWIR
ncbi:unnamed protein product [Rotaria sordida]|uniref:F-box domain-containing protein n=1 Tax=Rotaria sordida TaxID=392033 RepID=A0A815LMU5_9BILA|nr:unnamed protein product [Rotaria sordida]CAF1412509.1 unnamed protein product [Rotaria sordida]CAF1549364.1 unnamed protein product [Rotaria sordida]CAF1627805.1 unnamed protein product [Rotaria sordida]